MRKDIMWAIAGTWDNGSPFLYFGTWLTRKYAIAAHCQMTGHAWSKARADGARAVKVSVYWKYA